MVTFVIGVITVAKLSVEDSHLTTPPVLLAKTSELVTMEQTETEVNVPGTVVGFIVTVKLVPVLLVHPLALVTVIVPV